ncbi:MAG: AraC family transcriptional regulator [Bacteroidota bacterium]
MARTVTMNDLVIESTSDVPMLPIIEEGQYHAEFRLQFASHSSLQGTVHNIQIREGITMTLHDYQATEDLRVEVEFPLPILGFGNILEGSGWIDVEGFERFPFQTDVAEFYKINPHVGYLEMPAHKPLKLLNVHFTLDSFRQLLGTHMNELPKPFVDNLLHDEELFYHRGVMNSALRHTAHRSFHPDYKGLARQFFLEAQVLELIAHQLELFKVEFAQGTLDNLTPEEHEALERCRCILLERFAEPPSLLELAREVGLNDFKLKSGFKQKYGTTVYRYLQEYRLEQAKEWLQQGERVNEVAHRIGYESLSSFSKAFADRYGLRPSKMRKPAV